MSMNRLGAAGMLAAGAIAGGVLAGTLTANAAGSGSTASPPAATHGAPPMAGGSGRPDMGAAPVRSDETTPSDSIVATLTTKAEARVSGGTVYRVETDAGDGAYEAHMTKADGSLVTVKFDKNLDVTAVEDGMGQGDPRPAGAPGNAPTTQR